MLLKLLIDEAVKHEQSKNNRLGTECHQGRKPQVPYNGENKRENYYRLAPHLQSHLSSPSMSPVIWLRFP